MCTVGPLTQNSITLMLKLAKVSAKIKHDTNYEFAANNEARG